MRRSILSHLFKWRGVKLENEIKWERLIWEGKTIHHWERKNKRENHCDFRIPTREGFSNCNCEFFSPLDRPDFGTAGSTRVMLQIVWLDWEKDIWRKISVSHYLLYILGFYLLVSIVWIEGLFWFDYL